MSPEAKAKKYLVSGRRPVETSDGAVHAPGDTVSITDDAFNQRRIDAGQLVEVVATKSKPAAKAAGAKEKK